MPTDISIYETGSGGDAFLLGSDVATTDSLMNMPYLAMFGGNVEADTPTIRPESEQAFDWWGNSLLLAQSRSLQFNSLTERTLRTVALNSSGRLKIQQAVERDLEFMRDFAQITVEVAIISVNRVEITVRVQEPDNQQAKEFIYLWDATEQEIITDQVVNHSVNALGIDHSYLDHSYIDFY
jgi:hypothetical protein